MASSFTANKSLTTQIESMEPLLHELQDSLEENNQRLKVEYSRRRRVEEEKKQWQSRYQQIREDYDSMREDKESLREEVDRKCRKENNEAIDRLENVRRRLENSIAFEYTRSEKKLSESKGGIDLGETCREVLDVLESLTDQFISTQNKLLKAEDKVRDTETLMKDNHQKLESELEELRHENKQLFQEVEETREVNSNLKEQLQQLQDKEQEERTGPDVRETEAQTLGTREMPQVFKVEASSEEKLQLLGEIERLKQDVQTSDNLHRRALHDYDLSWREKMEKVSQPKAGTERHSMIIDVDQFEDLNSETESRDLPIREELQSDCLISSNAAPPALNTDSEQIENLKEKVNQLETSLQWAQEDSEIHLRCLDKVSESMSTLQDERRDLQEAVEQLSSQLHVSATTIAILESELETIRLLYEEAFVEISKIFECAGLEQANLTTYEDTNQMREMLQALSLALEKRNEKASLPDPSENLGYSPGLHYRKDPPTIDEGIVNDGSDVEKEYLNSLQNQIDSLKESQKANDLKKELEEKNAELKECENGLSSANILIDSLKAESTRISKELGEAKKYIESNMDQTKELNEVRDELNKLKGERHSLQAELKDVNIALSDSKCKFQESINALDELGAKFETSIEDNQVLRCALSEMDVAFRKLKEEYSVAVKKAEALAGQENSNEKKIEDFTNQLKTLTVEKGDLSLEIDDLEETLAISKRSTDESIQRIRSLEDKLKSTQQENKVLAEEILNVTSVLEDTQEERNMIADELAVAKDLIDEARLEAEKHGRESAGEEIRAEMRRIREDDRKEMKEKLAKCFEENTLLLRELAESRQCTSDALKSSNESNKEITRMKKEVELLQISLKASKAEIKQLKETELELNLALLVTQKNNSANTGRIEATKQVLTEMKDDRRREVNDFEKKLKDCEMALAVAVDARLLSEKNLERVLQEANSMKSKSRKFEQEVLSLAVEIERIKDEHESEMDTLRATAREGVNENASLIKQNATLKISLEQSKKERESVETKLEEAKTALLTLGTINEADQKVMAELESKLEFANRELEKLEPKVANLEGSSKGLRDELLREKTALKNQLREAKDELLQFQEKHDRNEKVLQNCRRELKESKDVSAEKSNALDKIMSELTKTNEAHLASMIVLENIRQLITEATNDLEVRQSLTLTNEITDSIEDAYELERKIILLVALVQEAKEKACDLEIFGIKYDKACREASESKAEAERVKSELHQAQIKQASLEKQMKKAKKQMRKLIARNGELLLEGTTGEKKIDNVNGDSQKEENLLSC